MANSTHKRRLSSSSLSSLASSYDEVSEKNTRTDHQDSSTSITIDEELEWKGYCEVESEPAFFNVMLKDFGVRGVKVHEIVSLDDEMLAFLPQPIYGLIFLFKWREEDPDKLEQSCPDGIWFANQTVNNACASVALLNIVINVPGIELGNIIQEFKSFTADFSPALRGDAVANFEFVKKIHNAFARDTDMLNGDLQLKNDANSKGKGKKLAKTEVDESNAGFHFIAYVPIDGKLWKLDGLERQPQNLGSVGTEDWMSKAKPDIEDRMAQYEDGQIEFAILSLVREPLLHLIPSLAVNVKSIVTLSKRLDEVKPDWKDFTSSSANGGDVLTTEYLTSPDPEYELKQEVIDQAALPVSVEEVLQSNVVTDIVACLQEQVTAQARLRASIRLEQESRKSDNERAGSRRHDQGPLLRKLVEIQTGSRTIKAVLAR